MAHHGRDEAARYLKLAGDHAAAAVQFRRAGLLEAAAGEFEQAGDHARAARLYRRLNDRGRMLRCLLQGGAMHEAGLEYERRGDLDKAGECFRRYAESSPEARQDLERRLAKITPKRPGPRAAIRLVALGRLAEAASIYARCRQPERAAELFGVVGKHESAARCLAQCGRYQDAAREVVRGGEHRSIDLATSYLADHLVADRSLAPSRIEELSRTAGKLVRSATYDLALAHYLAIGKVGGRYLHEVTKMYARLGRHADALAYILDHDQGDAANAYLDERPELVLSLAEVESLTGGSALRRPLPSAQDKYVKHALLRLLHGCLYRGAEPDRRERIAALLDALPSTFAYPESLFAELSDLMIELRLYRLIERTVSLFGYGEHKDSAEYRYFVGRLEQVMMQERDKELSLCLLLDHPERFEVAIATVRPTVRNVPLFALSSTRYREAVAVLLESGAAARAAAICIDHRDYARGARIYEQSGDLLRAARAYRDGALYADARRCFVARGDEVGRARVFERESRYEEALAIWQRLDRQRDVERLRKKMARRRED